MLMQGTFADLGIILPSDITETARVRCPKCGNDAGQRSKKPMSVNVADGLFICFRCNWSGKVEGKHADCVNVTPNLDKESKIRDRKRDALRRVWAKSQWPNAGPVIRYFENRLGILPEPFPQNILYHHNLPYWNNGRETFHPAMLGIVRDSDEEVVTLHRTYLTQDGYKATVENPKKIMSIPTGSCTGAAIRLYPPNNELIIAEGIETALSLYVALGIPAWAAISAHGLETVFVPASVQHVIIGADNDANKRGQQAAYILKRRLLKEGRSVQVMIPEQPGDWNDALRRR